jgi:predicted Zn-ribbon and HTH transcriptional regulator
MKVSVYFCKKCGYAHRVDKTFNLCPKCWHFMSEQEWEEEDYIDYCNKYFSPFGKYINP